MKSERLGKLYSLPLGLPSKQSEPIDDLIEQEDRETLALAMLQLGDLEIDVLNAYAQKNEHKTIKGAAETFGLSKAKFYSVLRTARRKCIENLKEFNLS